MSYDEVRKTSAIDGANQRENASQRGCKSKKMSYFSQSNEDGS